jgi:OOP family OmpA-OmpF porin
MVMNSAKTLIVVGVAAASLPFMSIAQDTKNQGYLVDTQGQNAIIRAPGAGVCVRTSDWTPARAVAECDPDLVKKPAPAPKKEPAKPLPQKVNFSGDALFDFDKSVLKPEGKRMLDDLVRTLAGANYDVILAIGHTDRIGSAAYNQKLSERRANAVKDYLVSKGIAASRITAEGRGKTQPVTKPGACNGLPRPKLIACLQPDRRVDVEVTGTKGPTTGPR